MKITHRISFNADRSHRDAYAQAGVDVELGFGTIVITESDARWPSVLDLIKTHDPGDTVLTSFSKKELSAARYLVMRSSWHHGYPEPSNDDGYKEAIYDMSAYCSECGSGKKQESCFQIKGEPKWGTRGILQLHWTYDEYFVKPEIWKSVFEPFGIESREVCHYKTRKVLKSVVQLIIPDSEVSFNLIDYASETCPCCKVVRYLPITRGPHPPLLTDSAEPIFKSINTFGSGFSHFKEVVISQELYSALEKSKVKGINYKVVGELES